MSSTASTSANSSSASSPPAGHHNHTSTTTTTTSSKTIPTSNTQTASTSSRKVSASSAKAKAKRKKTPRLFTPAMQDAQARGKNPHAVIEHEDSDDEMDLDDESSYGYGQDDHEKKAKIQGAAYMLDNPELIIMQSNSRGDSIPATRHFYEKMMFGYSDPSDPDAKLMEEPPENDKEKEKAKMKPPARDWDRQGRDWGAGT